MIRNLSFVTSPARPINCKCHIKIEYYGPCSQEQTTISIADVNPDCKIHGHLVSGELAPDA